MVSCEKAETVFCKTSG